jgi:hypothetical protein
MSARKGKKGEDHQERWGKQTGKTRGRTEGGSGVGRDPLRVSLDELFDEGGKVLAGEVLQNGSNE